MVFITNKVLDTGKIKMSTYKAIVAKVDKVEEILGANSIQVGYVLGERVVIGKDVEVGTIGVFFMPDIQLSHEFCYNNNLYRHAELNSNKEVKGFFDDNRRVRAQTFMKVKSDGFFAMAHQFDYIDGYDINVLPLGTQFEELDGHKICSRYRLERKEKAQSNKPKQAKKNFAPMFHEHVETEQFKYYAHKIPVGAMLYFHAKGHGCFRHDQKILMADGSKKEIRNINVGDFVIGWENGEAIPTEVTNTFINGKGKEWVEVHYRRNQSYGNWYGKNVSTPDHQYLLNSGNYKAAVDLNIGDKLILLDKTRKPSKQQIGAFIGMLLGDGYLSSSGNLQFCHKKQHEEYLNYKLSLFNDLGSREAKTVNKKSGYGSDIVFNMLPANHYFSEFLKYQIKGVGKVLDWDIVEHTTIETLAFLFLDDGSLSSSEFQKDRAAIAICGIRDEDIKIIKAIYEKFGINPVYHKDLNGYNRLRLNTNEAYKMFSLIKEYVPECVRYKFPEEMRKDCFAKDIERSCLSFYPFESEILQKPKLINSKSGKLKGSLKYDIETKTHNFVAGDVVVHNSSGRSQHSKVNIELPKWKQLINRVVPVFPTQEWKKIVGTRRVVLKPDDSEKVGFHGPETFREEVHQQIAPYLEKGMSAYYEIVGFANGKSIMPTHNLEKLGDKAYVKKYGKEITYTYNCKQTEFKFYIYRVSMTNEDGVEVDMSDAQCRAWCERRGLEYTLEVHPPIRYDGDLDKLCQLVEQLTERPEVLTEDYRDPSHISEGIIIRVEDGGLIPTFYKSKSYAFRCAEGHVVEATIEDQQEESLEQV